jgi:hypothetical protein
VRLCDCAIVRLCDCAIELGIEPSNLGQNLRGTFRVVVSKQFIQPGADGGRNDLALFCALSRPSHRSPDHWAGNRVPGIVSRECDVSFSIFFPPTSRPLETLTQSQHHRGWHRPTVRRHDFVHGTPLRRSTNRFGTFCNLADRALRPHNPTQPSKTSQPSSRSGPKWVILSGKTWQSILEDQLTRA